MLRYFAYGSNMLPKQMAERCRGAKLLCTARLDGWRFLMTKRGTANIVPDKNESVFGALWQCSLQHMSILDQYEGVSVQNYLRRSVLIEQADGRETSTYVYWATRHLPGPARTDYLQSAVLPGARALGLPSSYISFLESWKRNHPIGHGRTRYLGRRKRS